MFHHPERIGLLLFALVLVPLGGCDGPEQADEDGSAGCQGGKCDDVNEVAAALEGLDDPIAAWLRDNVDADGILQADYLDMLRGISALQGCDESQIDSYVIADALVADDTFPRVVNTVCSTDRTKADRAFFALSFANDAGTDVDTLRIEMFAWDDSEDRYRFYKTEPVEAGARLTIEPAECRDCHLTPDGLDAHGMPMTPIMNELAAPWQHWHAEPVSFDHVVPDEIVDAPEFARLASEGSPFRKSAARLEQTIRSAFNQRVAIARSGVRRVKPADIDDSMAALRPLFCDEQVTYVTEDGSSGLLPSSAVIDDGWHSVFFVVQGVGWPWEWWNDRQLRLPGTGDGEVIDMLPVRGASVVAYEKQFMNLRGLAAEQVARVRALDWHQPVMSDFRCQLWENALPRVRANPPIELTEDTRNATLIRALFDEIMVLHPAEFGLSADLPETIELRAEAEDRFVAMSSAQDLQQLAEALIDGTLAERSCDPADGAGICSVSLQEMGDLLEARFKSVESNGREHLRQERNRRACLAQERYGAFPHVGGLDC